MRKELVFIIKKQLVIICLIINQLICWFLPSGHIFETPKLYVHLITLVVLSYLYLFKKVKFNINWKAMLLFGAILGILYLFLIK